MLGGSVEAVVSKYFFNQICALNRFFCGSDCLGQEFRIDPADTCGECVDSRCSQQV